MILVAPGFLFFLFLIPPLIYFHLRRRKRTEITVSSLFLWTAIKSKVQTRFRRKLNQNLHLILQILIIIILSLTLSGLNIPFNPLSVERTVIIIDGSASMGIIESGVSRFDSAKIEAQTIIRERGGENISVILAGYRAQLISSFGESTENQIDETRKLSFSQTSADVQGSLLMGENLIVGYSSSEIILLSDGAFDNKTLEMNTDLPLVFIPIGDSTDNIGITSLESRKDPLLPNVHQVYIKVFNSFDQRIETDLFLYLDGLEYSRSTLQIPENGYVSMVKKVSAESGRLEAVIKSDDIYALDNIAYLSLETGNPVSLLLISEGNLYLESLFSITEGINLSVKKEQPVDFNYDVVVFDKPPIGLLPTGNYIFFGTAPIEDNITQNGTINFPGIKNWDFEHPVLSSVDPRSFSVYQSAITLPGREYVSILEGEVPLIYVKENEKGRSVYFTFNLDASDLVLRPAFPILLSNTVKWLIPDMESGLFKSSSTGQIIMEGISGSGSNPFTIPGELTNPIGERILLNAKNGFYSFLPVYTGFYTLKTSGKEYAYAVNLLSPGESNIKRRFNLPEQQKESSRIRTQQFFPMFRLLITLVLAIMIIELFLTRRKGEGSGTVGKIQLGLAVFSLIFLILVLSNISIIKEKIESTVVFLLDISRSISSVNRDSALNWISLSQPEFDRTIRTGMVTFGANAEVIKPPGPDLIELKSLVFPFSKRTNLEAGLNQALALLPESGNNDIIILTDGNETDGSISEVLKSMDKDNIRVSTVPLSGFSEKNEIIARSIIGPSRVSPMEHNSLTLEIESLEESQGSLFFYMDGEYYGEDSINILPGRSLLSYKVNLREPGYHLFEVLIESENDTLFENNRFRKMIFVEGDLPVLYVYNGTGPSEMLLGPLRDHGYSFEVISASVFPDTLNELYSYDSIILDNIPAYYFSVSKMEMIKKAVSGGLGMLVIGGDNSLGAGGYYNTPLEEILPVDVDITSSLDLPGTAIVMVIDNSGSMQDAVSENERKSDLAKQAVFSALEVLDPEDTAGILAFNADFNWVVRIEPELNMDAVKENLFPLKPGGGTTLLPALEEAFRVLDSTSASVKHILVLSDGYTDPEGFEKLLNNIRNSGITVSTVAVGSVSNKLLMENIAAWGRGRSYYTDDIHTVPSIFVSESLKASRRLFIEETFFPLINQPHEILTGITESEIPPLHGFMLTYPKPNSEILLRGIENNPLLSVWQYGIGRTAVFTSNLSGSWASDWYIWDSYKAIFSQLLRWISKGNPDNGLKLSLSYNRSEVYISVDAKTSTGEYLNGLELTGKVILPDLSELEVEVEQNAPGSYNGKFPVSLDGSYFVTVIARESDSIVRMENLNSSFISIPYPEEYRNIKPSPKTLELIRTYTGGDNLSLKDPLGVEFYTTRPEGIGSSVLNWRVFVLIAFLMFLLSLFFRFLPPNIVFAPIVRFLAFLLKSITGKNIISYNQFIEKMNNIHLEEEKSKRDYSYWFGKEKSSTDNIYISKLRKK
jgi:uncharacterized membrane protein